MSDHARFANYVAHKNDFDRAISSLAGDINSRIRNDQLNAPDLIERAQRLREQIANTQNEINANIADTALRQLKNQLLKVYDCELGRVDGLLNGMKAGSSSQAYLPHFQKGGEAAIAFDRENDAFNKMYNNFQRNN